MALLAVTCHFVHQSQSTFPRVHRPYSSALQQPKNMILRRGSAPVGIVRNGIAEGVCARHAFVVLLSNSIHGMSEPALD